MQWNNEEKRFIFKVNAFELFVVNFSYNGENTWHHSQWVNKQS